MKNREDLEHALLLELKHWFEKQCREPFSDFYLYYLETTAEHDGGIIILKDAPPNTGYKLACSQRIHKGSSIEQNFNWLRLDVIGSLPVLSSK